MDSGWRIGRVAMGLLVVWIVTSGCEQMGGDWLGGADSTTVADSTIADSGAQVDSAGRGLLLDTVEQTVPRLEMAPGAADSLAALRADSLRRATEAESTAVLQTALRDELRSVRTLRDSLRATLAAAQGDSAAAARLRSQADSARSEPAAEAASPAASSDDPSADGVSGAVQNFGLRMALAVLILVLGFFVVKSAVFLLEVLSERSAERRLLYKRIIPIARVLLWAIALYVVLRGIFNVDAQGLLAAATAIGVAVGFAAQDLLKNIFGGLVIIFDTPFQVGDKIAIGDTYGEVLTIGLRSTRIVTPDDNLVSVPNAQVVDGQVSNANAGALDCQVVTDLYLPGWIDETRAKQIARQAAASSRYVYLEKPIVVIVKDEYEDDHVVHLKVKAYVLDARYEFLLASDVTERARRAFREEGLLRPAVRGYVDVPVDGEGTR